MLFRNNDAIARDTVKKGVIAISNRLKNESSPYLLQHKDNPVDWYPWGEEAFLKAKREDKPIFLSIGYSTCHWCHVMAHESFEDEETAKLLNSDFISIKVDKEERPDIDSVYMTVCQAFTGSGGWPMSIFLTPEQKPFFAGTYFPKTARGNMATFKDVLLLISSRWKNSRSDLVSSAEDITKALDAIETPLGEINTAVIDRAVKQFKTSYDEKYGGFGPPPKFPIGHNIIFLLEQYKLKKNTLLLEMAENTLEKMYRGGMFDHIAGGFCRYSTDIQFLVPHFEKMLYDNAILIMAYCMAYELTRNKLYLYCAEKAAGFILNEMTSDDGAFFSAQDADSDGVEGKYYLFTPDEIISLLGEKEGIVFNRALDITEKGNFEGKSIPNLLHGGDIENLSADIIAKVYDYRKSRCQLHIDDKILISWNSLMISAMCWLYRVSRNKKYLDAAKAAECFIDDKMIINGEIYTAYREGRLGSKGFLDDYANYAFAQTALYDATLEYKYLTKAKMILNKALMYFEDEKGGFYLYGSDAEQLIMRPKECYDGAMPSGNSMMAYVMTRIYLYDYDKSIKVALERQLSFMRPQADRFPMGYSVYLTALSQYLFEPEKMTVSLKDAEDIKELPFKIPLQAVVVVLSEQNGEYTLLNGKTTYYLCKNNSCLAPTNNIDAFE